MVRRFFLEQDAFFSNMNEMNEMKKPSHIEPEQFGNSSNCITAAGTASTNLQLLPNTLRVTLLLCDKQSYQYPR